MEFLREMEQELIFAGMHTSCDVVSGLLEYLSKQEYGKNVRRIYYSVGLLININKIDDFVTEVASGLTAV